MNNNEELLDKIDNQKNKSKPDYVNRTIIYIVLMLGGGFLFSAFLTIPKFNIPIDAILNAIIAIAIAVPIELFSKYRRKRKNIKKGIEIIDDPLWFHILESALSILILYWVLNILISFLLN